MPLSKVVSNSLSLTTLAASGAATLNTLASSGATLTGGTINGMTIGAVTASSVAATTITASSTLGVTGVSTFAAGTAALPAITTTGDTNTGIFFPAADTIAFSEGGVEAMRINSSGNLLLGTTTNVALITEIKTTTEGDSMHYVSGAGSGDYSLNAMNSGGQNNAAAGIKMGKNSSTSRSINAAGTINASGADYAEYMVKAGTFTVAKGDVVGINAQGKLTNVFADAIAFVVKSTDPSYVGGDVWGNEESLGLTLPKYLADDATDAEKSKYASDKTAFETALEVARQTVDRIAFSGQVPVNVTGATAGQYIIPVNDNGAIKGQAVSNPTFEQYQIAVGKVISIESDGRAKIIVKVA